MVSSGSSAYFPNESPSWALSTRGVFSHLEQQAKEKLRERISKMARNTLTGCLVGVERLREAIWTLAFVNSSV